jgi:hypothetical protein
MQRHDWEGVATPELMAGSVVRQLARCALEPDYGSGSAAGSNKIVVNPVSGGASQR